MDEEVCPRCKTTKYRNPSLVLMVNICGHALCESCVDLLFVKGSGSCPECDIPLRRGNFRVQLFEDPVVEKEVDIRKKVLRDYNKKEDDFETLREFNDYLEEVETIIFNLTNNIDVFATNKKIEQFKKENKEIILKNKSKIGREELELEELLETEKMHVEIRKKETLKVEEDEKKKKMRDKEALIDELMFSNQDAKNIVETFTQNAKQEATKQAAAVLAAPSTSRATQFSTGIKFGRGTHQNFLPVPKLDEGIQYIYRPTIMITDGPKPPSAQEIEKRGFIRNVRMETEQEKAGGFRAQIACLRALQESLTGLYTVAENTDWNISKI